VGKKEWLQSIFLSHVLACAVLLSGQETQHKVSQLDRQFQAAISQYKAGNLNEAASQLESLLPRLANVYDVHELLGLVYAAQLKNAKATEQFEIAVRLKPDSIPARINLGTALFHSGKRELAEEQFRKVLVLDPENYDANHDLGELYIQSGKIADAVPFLEKAQSLNPSSYGGGYDLALAYFLTGNLAQVRILIRSLEQQKNTDELHNLSGQIEEKDGNFLAAAKEFETAARMNQSEENLFDWGSELLLHQAYEPAINVFKQAIQHYPHSARLMMGLGMTFYSQGKYDEAIQSFLNAVDLNPADPRCYVFLAKTYSTSPSHSEDVIQVFHRFTELQPGNAQAAYYYAMSLWKGKQVQGASPDFQQIRDLLQKAIVLDPKLADAHAQLGNLYAEQHTYDKAIPEYARALQLDPNLSDTHYRLSLAYSRVGEQDKAHEEFEIYQKLRMQHLAELDKKAAEIKQFVYEEKSAASVKQ
jgi:tetratricopeptide (TPR) repeat protein